MTLVYDGRGGVVQRGETTLEWDAAERMTRMVDGEGHTTTHDFGVDSTPVRTTTPDGVTYFLGENLIVEDGVASVYMEVAGRIAARVETIDLAAVVLSDLAPAMGSDDAITTEPDGAVNAADAWLAFAAEQGILTFAGAIEASPSAHLLSSSAAQELIGRSDRVTYLYRDQVDNTAAVTDGGGALVEATLRYPFGLPRWSTSNAMEAIGFTGLRSDASSLTGSGLGDDRQPVPRLRQLHTREQGHARYNHGSGSGAGHRGQSESGCITRKLRGPARRFVGYPTNADATRARQSVTLHSTQPRQTISSRKTEGRGNRPIGWSIPRPGGGGRGTRLCTSGAVHRVGGRRWRRQTRELTRNLYRSPSSRRPGRGKTGTGSVAGCDSRTGRTRSWRGSQLSTTSWGATEVALRQESDSLTSRLGLQQ